MKELKAKRTGQEQIKAMTMRLLDTD